MFQQEYGYFQVSAKAPPGSGTWAGFWMLPFDNLGGAELDVFEILGGYPTILFTTTHSVNSNGVHTADSIPNYESVDLTAAFHTYGVDWEPNKITWYLDGQAVAVQTPPPGFNKPMYMLLNLAIGGFGGTVVPGTIPADMQIDSLQAYATANTILVSGRSAIQTARISGVVNAGNGLLSGVNVGLVDAAGNLIASAVTDANGYFIFSTLSAGNYKILYDSPAGYAPATGGLADSHGGLTALVSLTDGQALSLSPETLIAGTFASLGGTVVKATGGAPAAPISGEVVNLLQGGTVIDSTISWTDGAFAFTNLAAGTYTLQYTTRSGEVLQAGGPANVTTGQSAAVSVSAGQAISLPVQTITPTPGAVSGTVLYSATGMQGIAGMALPGATVTLTDVTGATAVATAVTDSNGNYLFSGVQAGQYRVMYMSSAGYVYLGGSAANVATGLSYAAVFVTPGNRAVAPTETLTAASAVASVNGTVLFSDGVDPATAIAGVTVTLDTGAGQEVETAITDASGAYSFTDIGPGAYQVAFSAPAGDTFQIGGAASFVTGTTATFNLSSGQAYQAVPETLITNGPAAIGGSVLQTPSYTTATNTGLPAAGETVSLIGANQLVAATTTTDANGNFLFSALVPGIYTVSYTLPANDGFQSGPAIVKTGVTAAIDVQANQTVTLAPETLEPLPAAFSGSITYNGAAVNYAAVAVINAATGAVVETGSTNYTGTFTLGGLAAGSYEVRYTAPKGQALLSGPAAPATGLTAVMAVSPGVTVSLAAETLMPAPATITGSVRLVSGLGQAGITVAAISPSTGTAVLTTTTAADGSFQLTGLTAGSYQVQYTVPTGEVLQTGAANTTTGLTAAFTVGVGQVLSLSHETVLPTLPATIIGTVLTSANGKAAPQAGTTVTLSNSGGTLTATTSSTGSFQFKNLLAGAYTLSYAVPASDTLQAGGPANPATGLAAVTLAAGQSLTVAPETLVVSTASLSGTVLLSGTGQAGVAVALLNAAGTTLATTTTGATGTFQFTGLPAGSYALEYAAPTAEVLQPGGPANTTTGITGLFALTDGQALTAPSQILAPVIPGISGTVIHVGSGDPGTGVGAVMVSLLNATGSVLRTTLTAGSGAFSFRSLAAGTYALKYGLPTGATFQSGGPASVTTGIVSPFAFAAGQAITMAPQDVVSTSSSFTLNGPSSAAIRGDGSYTVTGNASSASLQLGNGSQSVTLTGFSDAVTTGDGNQTISLIGTINKITVGSGTQVISAGSGFDTVTLGATPSGTLSTVQLAGFGNKVVATGAGNVSVSGSTGSSSVTLGDGNQTVSMAGSGNTVTVGQGTSTINAGQNSSAVHAAGGSDTITITGQRDLFDAGAGMNFYNAGAGAKVDTFMLNGSGQGMTTVTGFNSTDTLDLLRTVAGLGVLGNLSNLGQFVTSSVSNGSTTLLIDPTGGSGTPYAFATLSNVSTSVAQLISGHNISLT